MIHAIQKSKYKKLIPVIGVVLLIAFIFIIAAPDADALKRGIGSKSGTATGVGTASSVFVGKLGQAAGFAVFFYLLLYILLQALGWLYGVAGLVLNSAFMFATSPAWFFSEAVVGGWTLVRDIANIFIILILLLIAIATILGFKNYHAKSTLAWLIIMAILVNFSLPLVRIAIDFGNIITLQFVEVLGKPVPIQGGAPGVAVYDIAGSIEQGLGVRNVLEATKASAGASGIVPGLTYGPQINSDTQLAIAGESSGPTIIPQAKAVGPLGAAACIGLGVATGGLALLACGVISTAVWMLGGIALAKLGAGTLIAGAVSPYVDLILTNLFLAIAIYVMFALAIFLLIRTVVLMLLTVLAPAAFVLAALPDTKGHAMKWWNTFISQVMFAPAMAILLWVTLTLMNGVQGLLQPSSGSLLDLDNGKLVFFLMFTAMLYACLLLARNMGTYGADTAIKWFGVAKGFAVGAVGGLAIRNTIGRAGEALQKQPILQRYQPIRQLSKTMVGAGARYPGGSRAQQVEEKTGYEIQSTFKKSPMEWHKDFATNKGYAYREAFAREIMKDEKKREQFMKNADAGTKASMLNIVRTKLGADAEKVFQNAEMKLERDQAKIAGTSITDFMKTQTADQQRAHFKAMANTEKTDWASEAAADKAEMGKLVSLAKTEMIPDEQAKFFDDSARKMLKDIDKVSKAFDDLPEEMKKSVTTLASRDELQKMAGKVADEGKFVDSINKHAPTRADDVIAVLPGQASKVSKTVAQAMATAELDKIPEAHGKAIAKDIAENMRSKQLPKLIDRSDALTGSVLQEVQKMYDAAGKSVLKLADAFDAINNKSMANWIRTSKKPKEILGLK